MAKWRCGESLLPSPGMARGARALWASPHSRSLPPPPPATAAATRKRRGGGVTTWPRGGPAGGSQEVAPVRALAQKELALRLGHRHHPLVCGAARAWLRQGCRASGRVAFGVDGNRGLPLRPTRLRLAAAALRRSALPRGVRRRRLLSVFPHPFSDVPARPLAHRRPLGRTGGDTNECPTGGPPLPRAGVVGGEQLVRHLPERGYTAVIPFEPRLLRRRPHQHQIGPSRHRLDGPL